MRAVAILACVAFAATVGAADLFRWKDKDGKVHFGDAPPPDAVEVQKLGIRSAPTDPAQLETQALAQDLKTKQSAMEAQIRADQAQRAEQERADKQAACEAARKRYASVQHSRKFATTGADGKEAWMSGADADKMKSDLKAAADEACAGL